MDDATETRPLLPPVIAPSAAAEISAPAEVQPDERRSPEVNDDAGRPEIAFAVLTTPYGGLVKGQVVFAAPDRIAALIAEGNGADVSEITIEAAFPFHFPLPEPQA